MDRRIKELITELSKKHKIPVYKVELIIMSEFQFLRDIIQDGEFESLRLIHLGRFKVTDYQKKLKRDKTKREQLAGGGEDNKNTE